MMSPSVHRIAREAGSLSDLLDARPGPGEQHDPDPVDDLLWCVSGAQNCFKTNTIRLGYRDTLAWSGHAQILLRWPKFCRPISSTGH